MKTLEEFLGKQEYLALQNGVKKTILFSSLKSEFIENARKSWAKNLTNNELSEYVTLGNSSTSSSFTKFDLMSYYKKLSDSREIKEDKWSPGKTCKSTPSHITKIKGWNS